MLLSGRPPHVASSKRESNASLPAPVVLENVGQSLVHELPSRHLTAVAVIVLMPCRASGGAGGGRNTRRSALCVGCSM